MKLQKKYLKWIKQEIESSETIDVQVTRSVDKEGLTLVITIKQLASTESYGSPEMRDDLASFYQPMDIAPGEYTSKVDG